MGRKKVEKLTWLEEELIYEGFMVGRIYARLGEKEHPSVINEKLLNSCLNRKIAFKRNHPKPNG